jgi:hypothetical protein
MIAPPTAPRIDRETFATGRLEQAAIAAQISGRPVEIAIASPGDLVSCRGHLVEVSD